MLNPLRRLLILTLIITLARLLLPPSARADGCASLTNLGLAYNQNFDALATTGTTNPTSSLPLGWTLTESGGSARDNEQYAAADGTSTTGDTYSYGATGINERALGGLQSGTLLPVIGACFTNNTGAVIANLAISYIGEEWRLGTAGRTDQLDFEYSTDATSLTSGNWTAVNPLDFVTPNTSVVGAKDGNNAANQASSSATVSGLSLNNGANIWLRWNNADASGADDGLALDTFALTPSGATPAITATKTYTLSTDTDGDNQTDPGDVLSYTIVISNDGGTTATGLTLSDTLDANLSQLGLASVSPVAFDDSFNTSINPVTLSVADGASDLFFLDYPGLNPAVSGISSFGGGSVGGTVTSNTAGSTVNVGAGGSLTVNANGSFNFTPATGFQGIFTFFYRLQNVVGPADGLVRLTVDAPPTVTTTSPLNGALNVNGASNITLNFSENVAIAAGGVTVDCGAGAVSFSPALPVSGVNTLTLDPTASLPGNATCTVTVVAANTTDADANDPPNQLDGNNNGIEGDNYSFSFQIAPTANDDSFAVTPHLTLNSSGTTTVTVRANDDPTSVTITGFGFSPSCSGTTPGAQLDVGAANGRLTLNADGTLSYEPPAGVANTTRTFCYTVTGGDTANITFSLQDTQLVWFVDAAAGGGGIGTQARPFQTLTAAAGVDTADDTIFVKHNAAGYTCGVTLLANERLIGEGSGSNLTTLSGIMPVAGSAFPALTNTSANWPNLTAAANCIVLATGNTIRGFNFGNVGAANTALSGTSFGALTILDSAIATNGRALNLDTGTFNATLDGLTSTSGTNNVNLVSVSGTATLGSGALSGATGTAFNVSGGTVSATYNGSITQANNAALVSMSGGHNTGTITFQTGTLNATNGSGLQFDNADGMYNFNGTTTLNGGDAGIDILNGSGGTFNFGGTTITNPTGIAFNVDGSAAAVTGGISISGPISKNNAGRLIDFNNYDTGTANISGNLSCTSTCDGIEVTNNGASSGTVNFGGGAKTLNTGADTAVNLDNNDVGTINFSNGGLAINTTTGGGFNAINGGTVTVQGTGNTINSTTGTALNVVNATIGGSGLTFQSISSNGGSNTGIILNATVGSSGALTVTGTGAAGTGGTIANKTGANGSTATGVGIYLNNTGPVSLSRMQMNDFQNFAILGSTVANFILRDSVINGVSGTLGVGNAGGNPSSRESVIFITDLSGASGILNSTISGGATDNLRFIKNSGTLNLTITGNTIQNNDNTNGGIGEDGIFISTEGSSLLFANIANNTFANHHGDHISASGNGTSQLHVTINNNGMTADGGVTEDFDNNGTFGDDLGGTILVVDSNSADVFFDVSNNTMFGAVVTAITINQSAFSTAAASLSGRVQNNIIGTAAITDSGSAQGSGIAVDAQGLSAGAGLYKITISVADNDVFEYNNHGLLLASGDGSSALAATVTSNIINNPGTFGANGIHLNHGKTSAPAGGGGSDSQTGCFDIRTNNIVGAGSVPNGAADFRLRQRFNTTVQLVGYTGAASDTAAVVTYVQGLNTGVETGQASVPTPPTGGGFTNTLSGANCSSPTLPTLPSAP